MGTLNWILWLFLLLITEQLDWAFASAYIIYLPTKMVYAE
jgi:hypothetical protein